MCCTKYGEDGQSDLILDKSKKPEKSRRGKNKDIVNLTSESNKESLVLPIETMGNSNSRNQNGIGQQSKESPSLPYNPHNTQMGDTEDAGFVKAGDFSASVQTFGNSNKNTMVHSKNMTSILSSGVNFNTDDTDSPDLEPLPEYR